MNIGDMIECTFDPYAHLICTPHMKPAMCHILPDRRDSQKDLKTPTCHHQEMFLMIKVLAIWNYCRNCNSREKSSKNVFNKNNLY